ncbi:glycosyltransferase [Helicobacter sp.]|uniref:glycosyltransferase n=1 Tax=Helicobacter sp. TaxID=218 RepID=UPI0025BD1D33|nr:glycosyltransferase [Helicobacter sp.]
MLPYTLYSLFTQTLKPDKIILYLALEEYPNQVSSVSQTILAFLHKGLEIRWVAQNLKPYNKLIFALQDFPDDIIITIDDDTIYSPHWLELLYNAYQEAPQFIHAHRAHLVSFDADNNLLPYHQWESCIDYTKTSPSFLNFLTGVGGVLYPPHTLDKRVQDWSMFMNLCPTADDVWFWAMAVLQGTKINVIKHNISELKGFADEGNPLWHINCLQEQNDVQIKNILTQFPQIKEKIIPHNTYKE